MSSGVDMNDDHVRTVQNYAVRAAMYIWVGDRVVSAGMIEADKRSRKRVAGELVKAGYLKPSDHSEKFTLTEMAFSSIATEAPDLKAEWDRKYRFGESNTHLPYVEVSTLTLGRQKSLLEREGDYEWFSLSHYVLNHLTPYDKGVHLLGSGDRRSAIESARAASSSHDHRLVVTDPELRKHAAEKVHADLVEHNYPDHLGWGLVVQGIISEGEIDAFGRAFFNPTGGPLFPGSKSRPAPELWEGQIAKGLKAIEDEVERLRRDAEFLRAVDSGVAEAGGWEAVKSTYLERLSETLKRESEGLCSK